MTEATTTEPVKVTKSIVPKKYADRYKNPNDALAKFITEQCTVENNFDWGLFFGLCRANGIPEEQVAKYEELVTNKAHGAEGRARMTLRNMLATIVRKTGKLTNVDKEEVEMNLPKPTLSGAAAKAAAAKTEESAS